MFGSEAAVDIVIPVFDMESVLGRALVSVQSQSFTSWRAWVVDDGSRDRSAGVADEFAASDSRIRVIRQSNAGPGAARNRGITLASSEFVAFLDADDEWAPGYLEAQVSALNLHPECAMAVASWPAKTTSVVHSVTLAELRAPNHVFSLPDQRAERDVKTVIDAVHSSATVARLSAVREFGGFYSEDRCTYGEDAYLWAQMAFSHPFVHTSVILMTFHADVGALGQNRSTPYPLPPLLSHGGAAWRAVPEASRGAFGEYLKWYQRWILRRAILQRNWTVVRSVIGATRASAPRVPWQESPPGMLLGVGCETVRDAPRLLRMVSGARSNDRDTGAF